MVFMTNDIFKGKWKQLQGEVQKQWGKLTNDELEETKGEETRLAGLLQERYGYKKEEVRQKLVDFVKKHSDVK